MLWEEFRSLALPVLGERFPPNLIEDNGDCIVVTSRRDFRSYVLTETERGIIIAYEGERNTVVPFCITKSPELATTCLSARTRRDSHAHGHVAHTSGSLRPHPAHGIHHFEEVPTVLRSQLDYRSRGIREMPIIRMRSSYRRGLDPLPGLTAAVESRQSIAHAEEEQLSHERRTRRIHHSPV